jgi:hypothetical protein
MGGVSAHFKGAAFGLEFRLPGVAKWPSRVFGRHRSATLSGHTSSPQADVHTGESERPLNTTSAATMIACAYDEIAIGKHSAIGPIDPQMLLHAPAGGQIAVPAQAQADQPTSIKAPGRSLPLEQQSIGSDHAGRLPKPTACREPLWGGQLVWI